MLSINGIEKKGIENKLFLLVFFFKDKIWQNCMQGEYRRSRVAKGLMKRLGFI